MAYVYSRPDEDASEFGMPNIEVFYAQKGEYLIDDEHAVKAGWYWWACFPGCMPDGDPSGPFRTEEDAIADAIGEDA